MIRKTAIFFFLVSVLINYSFSISKSKILIIGDSISIGYTPFVKEKLTQKASVFHNPGNAQHTGTGLKNVEKWLGEDDWDIVQFNWGLWDLCSRHPDSKASGNRDKINGTITYSVEDYARNLDSIIGVLKRTTKARLVFVTTTYVPKNEAGRVQKDVLRYNSAAIDIMKKHHIAVNDVYKASKDIHEKHSRAENDVHYTEAGYKQLGVLISDFLSNELTILKE